MDIYLAISATISLLLVLLALVIIYNNRGSSLHRNFSIFSTSFALWITSNYLSNSATLSLDLILIANYFTLAFSGLGVAYLLRYVAISIDHRLGRLPKVLALIGIVTSLLCMTPLVVVDVARQGDVYAIEFGPLANAYFISLLLNLGYIFAKLIKGYRHSKGIDKKRLRIIFWSMVGALGFVVVTNVFLPLLFNSFLLTNLGPASIAILVVGISYTMVKHRLFDVRLVVARAFGYLLSVFSLTAVYALLGFFALNRIIFGTDSITLAQEIAYITLALFLAFTFQPVKSFFDRITNRVFYRDAYDTQVVLDTVSSIIVGNIDPHKIQKGALEALSTAVRPTFIVFLLAQHGNNGMLLKQGDVVGERWRVHDPEALQGALWQVGKKITMYDELEGEDGRLRGALRAEDISVVSPLVTKDETIGYLVLGPKKSGNIYNSQDMGLLTIASNELAVALQNAQRFEEIEQFNITLQQKIDQATRQLKRANDKLITLNDTKDDFISMASHQLRTPLTAVKGNISMIMDEDFGKIPKTIRDPLGQAYTSSERMVGLIADLLNVSRLRTGKFAIQPVPSNLDTVVKSELKQLQEAAKAHKLTLTYHGPKSFPTLLLDEIKIRQVIMNFIDNAIYYTPAGGHINVTLTHTPKAIEFTVDDDGIGVPRHLQRNLFTKFYRADNAQKMRPDGTGIGLFMAKKVTIASGGSVIFKSIEGKGSTFGFTIPLSKLPAPPPQAKP